MLPATFEINANKLVLLFISWETRLFKCPSLVVSRMKRADLFSMLYEKMKGGPSHTLYSWRV